MTLFLTTHDMDEAALLADRVGIMDHGTLLALDTPEALMRSAPRAGRRSSSPPAGGPAGGADRRGAGGARRASTGPSRSAPARTAIRTPPPRANGEPLRVRLYVTGDAALLVAPAAAVLAAHGLALPT